MHRHLVAVEVCVEGGADEGVNLDSASIDEHRLEGLDAQAVQCGGAVEEHGAVLDDVVQDVPHFRAGALHNALGGLDVVRQAAGDESVHHERLEQLQGHSLGNAALVQLQLRPHDDDGAAGVVYSLSQQVLAEAALLALQHVRKGFQLVVASRGDGAAAAAVINEGVYSLLEHSLLIADDDLRCS